MMFKEKEADINSFIDEKCLKIDGAVSSKIKGPLI